MTLIVNEMGEGQMANDIHLNTDIVNQITVDKNISQEIIVINIDKVKLILNEHQKKVQKKIDLINPLALFLTLLVANITAEFTDTWGLGKDVWKAIFVLLNMVSFCWLAYCAYNVLYICRGHNVESVIKELKQSSSEQHD